MDPTRALEAMHRSRGVPSTCRVHAVGDAIGLDLDVAVEIGSEDGQAGPRCEGATTSPRKKAYFT